MANDEKIETWQTAVDRVIVAASALKATVKMFEQAGATTELAFKSVEATREAFIAAVALEKKAFGKLDEPEAQQGIPGVAPGAAAPGSGPRALRGPRQLPPHAAAGEE